MAMIVASIARSLVDLRSIIDQTADKDDDERSAKVRLLTNLCFKYSVRVLYEGCFPYGYLNDTFHTVVFL